MFCSNEKGMFETSSERLCSTSVHYSSNQNGEAFPIDIKLNHNQTFTNNLENLFVSPEVKINKSL
ncbi:hypothetical protein ASF92_20540 [Pedobacter sp. Leaf176]|nr:hypothetical protein ASF92_20540 [Pedobacter sp. Leaf176]